MNRTDFLNLMENPVIDPKLTTEIGEITAIFPYFQTAHLLLLKGLHLNSDIRFGNQLRNSAMHVADREILYQFLFSAGMREGLHSQEAGIEEDKDTGQTVIESAKNSEELINEIEKNPEIENSEEENENEAPGNLLLDAGDETYVDEINSSEISNINELLELDLDRNGIKDAPSVENEIIEEKKDNTKLTQADLIERFIITNPRIEPVRDKKEVPVEDKSAIDTGEGSFVTETLAKIYIGQGYYSKAIDIFEKLSLKYPEKSSYFATQIEKVKEYLKK